MCRRRRSSSSTAEAPPDLARPEPRRALGAAGAPTDGTTRVTTDPPHTQAAHPRDPHGGPAAHGTLRGAPPGDAPHDPAAAGPQEPPPGARRAPASPAGPPPAASD